VEVGDYQGAVAWAKVAKYCTEMAISKAVDDDQFKFQRDRMRQRDSAGEDILPFDETVEARLVSDAFHGKRQLSSWALLAIELVLQQLSPLQRVCFELVDGGLVDVKDVAAALSIKPAQVRQHLLRARREVERIKRSVEHLIPGPTIYDPGRWYVHQKAS
jgi:DNA-binding CsgD family transcriptional regulator